MNKGAVKKRLICMMGVRGAGKNTQIRSLLEQYSQYFGQALSCKTRDFRVGEIEGVDYYKVDHSIFANSDVEIVFLETNGHFGNRYGTRHIDVMNVLNLGKNCLKELEPEGFVKVFKKNADPSYVIFGIFMDIPNHQIRSRMECRGDTEIEIQKALDRADFERQLAFLYSSVFGECLLRFVDASKSKEEVFNELLCLLGVKSGLTLSVEDIYETNPNAKIILKCR